MRIAIENETKLNNNFLKVRQSMNRQRNMHNQLLNQSQISGTTFNSNDDSYLIEENYMDGHVQELGGLQVNNDTHKNMGGDSQTDF